jgi:hypothetical protein
MAMDNITSNNNANFYWWFGAVEDRNDPLRLGRCRVRIIGYHTEDIEVLPTEDLPWAMPVMPANSAGTSGVGWSPTGAVEGSWVVGFFADGENGQHPMFFGTVGAIPGGLRAGDCAPDSGPGSSTDGATTTDEDGGQPISAGPPNQEFWTLVAICAMEAGIGADKAQDQCDVAQSIYNRMLAGVYYGKSVTQIVLAGKPKYPGQYEPTWSYPKKGKDGYVNEEWKNITDVNSASKATGKPAKQLLTVAQNLKNKELQDKSRKFVGPRTDFRGNPYKNAVNNRGSRVDRIPGSNRTNAFGFNTGSTYNGEKGVAQVPAFVNNQALA